MSVRCASESGVHSAGRLRGWSAFGVTLALLCSVFAIDPAVGKAWSVSGTVRAWGDNLFGQSTVPTGLGTVAAVSAGTWHSLALTPDGTVHAWGDNSHGQTTIPAGLRGVVAIAAGGFHSLALKADGTVVGWGYDADGQSTVPAGLRGVVAIAAGGFHSLALKSDGTVVGWGYNGDGETTVPAGLTGVVAIAAGDFHSMALKSDGTVVEWGYDFYGQTDVPAGLHDVVRIASGAYHSLALKSDGTVVAWGHNDLGETTVPAGLTGVVAISAGQEHSLALRSDGTVAAWGGDELGQTKVPAGLHGVVAVAAGGYANMAVVGTAVVLKLHLPADRTVEATRPTGAIVTYRVTVTDPVDPDPTMACKPASGSVFALGSTTVRCNAKDDKGNTAAGHFSITVRDTRPPVVTTAASVHVGATSRTTTAVHYPAAHAKDLVSGSVPATCLPASGSRFALGSTTVTCRAKDAAGNTGVARFPVVVTYAWTGVLAPLQMHGEAVMRAGRTVPVAFAFHDASAAITDATARLSYAAHTANPRWHRVGTFTFEPSKQVYRLGWSTQALPPGRYLLRIDLGDGVLRLVKVTLSRDA